VARGIGDRRSRARFEIVGTLTGTLQTWRRLEIRNLGATGALLEASVPLPPGSRIGGRLALRGRSSQVQAEVRHITTLVERDSARYLMGVQWDSTERVADLFSAEGMRPVHIGVRENVERRQAARFIAGSDAELEQPQWATVELLDVSTTGVLFSSPMLPIVGERGELRARLGDASFLAQVEVRRTAPPKPPVHGHRVGASFVTLPEGSRLHLEDFIGNARH
jgi:hypothetical protein